MTRPSYMLVLAALMLPCCPVHVSADEPDGFAVMADWSGAEVEVDMASVPAPPETPWTPTEADANRGFAAYIVSPSEDVTPNWVWPEPMGIARIDTFACPGQYRAAAVAVRALGPMRGLRARCAGLRSKSGATLDAENIDIRNVQYVRREARGTTALWEGRWLERSFPTDLPAHCTAWLWITVHVPEGTR
ncbi:MAG TPA: hypothetical protein QGF05_02730, partial [Dehalococcoidia bacterium]|nr:hypothetical protein [Dehalococcoidia bacterium]